MMQRFEAQQWVPFPVELVFAFFASPANLPRLMPAGLKTRIEDARIEAAPPRPEPADASRRFRSIAAGAGSEILISFCPVPWLPIRTSWMARIVEFAWNSHFCDEQVRGPFASFRHCHGIRAEVRDGAEGTLVSDNIEFSLPFGFLGGIASVFVRRQLATSFAHRQRRLPQILEAAAKQAVQRA